MQIWTSMLTTGDIATANAVVKATGPLSNTQAELLAGYFDLKMGTVQAYFSGGNKRGLLLRQYAGIRPCAVDPQTDNEVRRRIFMGVSLEADGGLARDPLYTGKSSRIHKQFATLEECGQYEEDVIAGAWDSGMGFRLSKAWTNLLIYRADDTDDEWGITIVYNGLGGADESDPAEPFAAFTLDGEEQPIEETL